VVTGLLEVIEKEVMNRNHACGEDKDTPFLIEEQEGQQDENAKVHFDDSMPLLNVQTAKDHTKASDRQPCE
jgi:hypothetical protein